MKSLFFSFALLVSSFSSLFALENSSSVLATESLTLSNGIRVTLPSGTQVMFDVAYTLDGKNLYPGQSIPLRVKFDIEVDGKVLITAGSMGTAMITRLEKPKSFGKSGLIEITPISVSAVDGQQVMVTGMPFIIEGAGGGKTKAIAASIGAAALTGGVGLIAGAFVKGKNASINAGTILMANTVSNAKIELNKEN